MDFSGRPGLAQLPIVLFLSLCCLVSASSSPAGATSSSSSSSAFVAGAQSPAVLLLQCTSIRSAYSSAPSSSRACQALDDPSEVQVRLSVQVVSTTTPHGAAAGGDLLAFTGRCGPAGVAEEGLLRAELPLGEGGHQVAGIALNVSLLPASSSAPLPAWAGEESSAWVDFGADHHHHHQQQRGVVMAVATVAHLPAGALAEGRLPGCYPLLSFRAALLRREGTPIAAVAAAAGQTEGEGEEEEEEGSSLLSSHSRRQSVTAQSVCDDREREVIGLASGLGVTGALLVCTLLGCFAIVGFQQYRLRNAVAGGGGSGGGGGGYGGAKRGVQDYEDEDLDYGEGRRGGKGGVDRGRAATAARSMGRDVDVDVPELGHATSPRGARQVNKTADSMAHLREVDDDMEMQPTNASNIPAPLW